MESPSLRVKPTKKKHEKTINKKTKQKKLNRTNTKGACKQRTCYDQSHHEASILLPNIRASTRDHTTYLTPWRSRMGFLSPFKKQTLGLQISFLIEIIISQRNILIEINFHCFILFEPLLQYINRIPIAPCTCLKKRKLQSLLKHPMLLRELVPWTGRPVSRGGLRLTNERKRTHTADLERGAWSVSTQGFWKDFEDLVLGTRGCVFEDFMVAFGSKFMKGRATCLPKAIRYLILNAWA